MPRRSLISAMAPILEHMGVETETFTEGPERRVGHAHIEITVTNAADEVLAQAGHIGTDQVRQLKLDGVLVDTGATTLCLPEGMVEQLGLEPSYDISVATATGVEEAKVYSLARLRIEDRVGVFECIALPEGSEPLLGVIPLEMLGLELDLRRQRLRFLPRHGRLTHMLAY